MLEECSDALLELMEGVLRRLRHLPEVTYSDLCKMHKTLRIRCPDGVLLLIEDQMTEIFVMLAKRSSVTEVEERHLQLLSHGELQAAAQASVDSCGRASDVLVVMGIVDTIAGEVELDLKRLIALADEYLAGSPEDALPEVCATMSEILLVLDAGTVSGQLRNTKKIWEVLHMWRETPDVTVKMPWSKLLIILSP